MYIFIRRGFLIYPSSCLRTIGCVSYIEIGNWNYRKVRQVCNWYYFEKVIFEKGCHCRCCCYTAWGLDFIQFFYREYISQLWGIGKKAPWIIDHWSTYISPGFRPLEIKVYYRSSGSVCKQLKGWLSSVMIHFSAVHFPPDSSADRGESNVYHLHCAVNSGQGE